MPPDLTLICSVYPDHTVQVFDCDEPDTVGILVHEAAVARLSRENATILRAWLTAWLERTERPALDIQVGDVWEMSGGAKVTITRVDGIDPVYPIEGNVRSLGVIWFWTPTGKYLANSHTDPLSRDLIRKVPTP